MTVDERAEALMLAKVLLDGFTDYDARGLPFKKYIADETEARHAIARLLREGEPLDWDLREKLAALFDPDTHPAIAERKIVFSHRGRGQRQNYQANTAIAQHVWDAVTKGGPASAAILSAADQFKLDESTVKKLWRRYRRVFEAVWGPLGRGGAGP